MVFFFLMFLLKLNLYSMLRDFLRLLQDMRGQNGANPPTFRIFISSPNLIVFSLEVIRFGLALVMSEIEGGKGS